jgi:hypothetical protein
MSSHKVTSKRCKLAHRGGQFKAYFERILWGMKICDVFTCNDERENLTLTIAVRILVQDPSNNAFFSGAGWIEDSRLAKTFGSVTEAEASCREHRLVSALVVLKFENTDDVVSYPVGARGALLVSKPATQRINSIY